MSRAGRLLWFIVTLVALWPVAVCGQETGQGKDTALVRQINVALNTPALRAGFVGVLVQSCKDNTILYARNADRLFLPASNAKLFTAGIALQALGKEFVYRTRLARVGTLTPDGTLTGDLVIRGEGDPLLAVEDLDALAQQAGKQGIRRVTGDLRYDDSRFDRKWLGAGWMGEDEPFSYAAQVGALNVNENRLSVQAIPGKQVGDAVQLVIAPSAEYVTVENRAVTGAAGSVSTLKIGRVRGQNILTVEGSLPLDVRQAANAPVDVTIEDPARFTAFVLAERLRKAGIEIAGVPKVAHPDFFGAFGMSAPLEASVVVAEHDSAPLRALLPKLLLPSDNLVAECLLKTVGAATAGQGTAANGLMAERKWLVSLGMDAGSANLADGSGLSRVDLVSPRAVVGLLMALRARPDFDCFYGALPVAGVSGTLRHRLLGTSAANNCHAKTGTMAFVSSLSGYVTTKGGEILAFSILMNDTLAASSACHVAQDKIVTLLADYTQTKE